MARPDNRPQQAARAAVAPAPPARPAELPLAETRAPFVTALVLVTTAGMIRGRSEHAAIVTAAYDADVIDVTLLPAGEPPYPVERVRHAGSTKAGAITWRWPPRS